MKSEKREKFERLAEKRVSVLLNQIRVLGNLSNRVNYDYTEEHVAQIMRALRGAIRDMETRFGNKGQAEADAFKFSD